MELLGEACVSADERDNLFIVGVFSMLPSILQVPMPALMEQLRLAETITDALLTRGGLFGPILTVAEGVEGGASPTLESTVADLQLSTAQVNRFHLEAIAWAEQITA
jgi:c-di-GMP phosphodiesterase